MRHLQTFHYIEAIVRAGSIRAAAETLNITASALNRRIQRFEDEFGSDIFERLPRGVRLSPAGKLVLQHFRQTRSDLNRVMTQVVDLSGEREGMSSSPARRPWCPIFFPNRSRATARTIRA